MEAETLERGYSLPERSGLPKIHGLPTTSSMYSTSSSGEYYGASPKHPKSKRSSHSGELQSPFYANANSNGNGKQGFYPTLDT
jgi:dynamin 1-like protein